MTDYYPFERALIALSISDDYIEALNEWTHVDIDDHRHTTEKCICGVDIKTTYWCENEHTGAEVRVGSVCIGKIREKHLEAYRRMTGTAAICTNCDDTKPLDPSEPYCKQCRKLCPLCDVLRIPTRATACEVCRTTCVHCGDVKSSSVVQRYCKSCRVPCQTDECGNRAPRNAKLCLDCELRSTQVGFGKHRHLTVAQLRDTHPQYCGWLSTLERPCPRIRKVLAMLDRA